MFQLAIRRELLDRMPLFPNRLDENPPREGFFEHAEYLKVRAHAPASYQDVLDFAYYSGWRRNEILGLGWDDVDLPGGVIRLTARRSKTKTGRSCRFHHPSARSSTDGPVSGTPAVGACLGAMACPCACGVTRCGMPAARPTCRIGSSMIAVARPRGT